MMWLLMLFAYLTVLILGAGFSFTLTSVVFIL